MDEDEPYDISICAEDGCVESLDALLRRAVETALRGHGVGQAFVEIVLVSDERIAALNERYLSHEGPTDVLTFDLNQRNDSRSTGGSARGVHPEAGGEAAVPRTIEGQIVVSCETAQREAQVRNHSASAELTLYVVHGILHLLGYDDHEEADSRRMHEREDELLKEVGVGPVFSRPGGPG